MTGSTPSEASAKLAGKYRLVEFIGAGGVGEVWRAENELLEVPVAVKLLRGRCAADPKLAERMTREAQATARLSHPAIVKVFDFGTTDEGDPFLVMELLRGETLADLLDRQERLPAIAAVQAVLPIAEALALAHARGVVHRDIKPENVFLARVGGRMQPKVLDFGIALAEAIAVRRTTHGAIMGSPVYMSPEQARGAEVGASTDLWALCVVLFELMTATLPFSGENYHAVLRAIIEDECPSLSAFGAGDDLLASIVERGLSKDPSRRFGSARELGSALAEWLLGQGVSEDAAHVSLRAGWLARVSEPPTSLQPMVVGPSDRPPRDPRATLASPLGVDAESAKSNTSSVEGLSLTASQAGRQRRRLWLSSALAAALVLGAAVIWLRPKEPPRSVSSATPEDSVAPVSVSASAEPTVSARSDPPPIPSEAADAGAPRAEPQGSKREPRPQSRPAKPRESFRPRGI